eukprot:CAMPEP_0119347724 /NCGR_PEP_ID=MMETSP1333-20130426/108674_1 /TAXON_ID=418940 /ORGANISM="Scyphosphaera apsteinii, Strain RCC1455" /LENGTH=217 /DNA_ID=CAMNT_0007360281 /DNA_START=23 /DNA_END=673 /DNA_ORIENTATION=+
MTALLALLLLAAIGAVACASCAAALHNGSLEEARDDALSEELFAAAASSAAYVENDETARLCELRARGVESGNWRMDKTLSNDKIAVFVNWYRQLLVVAFRGSLSLSDWKSNIVHVVPGNELASVDFRNGLETARAAQRKYLLFRRLQLTGHSRGGSMADFVGRKLGLPSIQINPGSWGKLLREEEPAVHSVTTRTADLVSLPEAIYARDRTVIYQW